MTATPKRARQTMKIQAAETPSLSSPIPTAAIRMRKPTK
jgi:hypothetical protein